MTDQDPQKQLQALVRQVRAESEKDAAQRKQALAEAEDLGAPKAQAAQEQLAQLGLSESALTPDRQAAADLSQEVERISKQLSQAAPASSDFDVSRVDLTPGSIPDGVQVLRPSFSSIFSSSLQQSDASTPTPTTAASTS